MVIENQDLNNWNYKFNWNKSNLTMKSFIRAKVDCVNQNKTKKQKNWRKSTAKSLAKLFKQESKQLDKVLESYDVVFDISPVISSCDAQADKPYLTSKILLIALFSLFCSIYLCWANNYLEINILFNSLIN